MGLDQSWCLQLDFEANMASSRNGTCPHYLSQGLVAETRLVPVCLLALTNSFNSATLLKQPYFLWVPLYAQPDRIEHI